MTNLFGTSSPYNQWSYPKVSCPHHKAPKAQATWMSTSLCGSQVEKLHAALAKWKNKGVTEGMVVYSFLGRRVQPLQRRVHPGFRYERLEDPSRFTLEKIHYAHLFNRCYKVLDDLEKVPALPSLFSAANHPENAWESSR